MSHMWLNLPGLPPLFLHTLKTGQWVAKSLRMRLLVIWTLPLWAQGFTVLLVYHLLEPVRLEPVRLEPACQILERCKLLEVAASDVSVANCNVVTSLVGRALLSEYHPTSATGSAEPVFLTLIQLPQSKPLHWSSATTYKGLCCLHHTPSVCSVTITLFFSS